MFLIFSSKNINISIFPFNKKGCDGEMASSLKVGDKVILNAEYDWNGTHLCSWTKGYTFEVLQVGAESRGKDYIVIGIDGQVTAGVHEKDLSPVNPPKKVTKKPKETKPKEPSSSDIAGNILKNVAGNNNTTYSKGSIPNGQGRVMETDNRYGASSLNDQLELKRLEEYKKKEASYINQILRNEPAIVKNAYSYPETKGFNSTLGRYEYNYYANYDKDKLPEKGRGSGFGVLEDMDEIRKSLNTDVRGRQTLYKKYVDNYNKFKMVYGDDMLSKTFAHVFFVRPDCNIFKENGSNYQLIPALENLPDFYYARRHCPDMLRQLTQSKYSFGHQFMLYPSNKVRSFEVADEYITTDSYGQGCTGYKIPYGKHNVESRTSDKFSITYIDDRDLHLYNMHKLWIDYISYVYRGKIVPKKSYMQNKVIDYATCLYYILCAEDGETVIFWSKYWGVFPTKAPSSSFSFTADNPGGISKPEFTIEYQYAWKEDFNPLSMVEFNEHGGNHTYKYIAPFQQNKLGPSYTWSGAPFVETFNSTKNDTPYTFRLRFRPM